MPLLPISIATTSSWTATTTISHYAKRFWVRRGRSLGGGERERERERERESTEQIRERKEKYFFRERRERRNKILVSIISL